MTTTTQDKPRRRGRPRNPQLDRPDVPYTMKLPDGRTVYVEVPGRWTRDVNGYGVGFLPEAVTFLDRVRALAVKLDRAPSPGYITALREALGLTQAQLGERIGVDRMTVSRWERGELHPSAEPLAALERVRREAVQKGAVIGGHEGLNMAARRRTATKKGG
jgi:DNA-binding transcriptional regulator YiaG